MLTLGGATRDKAFARQIRTSHQMRVHVTMHKVSNGDEVSDLTSRLLDGQVNVDSTADVTRSADLTLNDPDHVLHLDSRGAGDGGMYLDRLIHITYGVFVEAVDDWIDVPIFHGPIVGMARDGSVITINCLGLDHIARATTWLPLSFKTGHNTVDAIRTILRERAGETRFMFPSGSKARIPKPGLSLGRMTQPWVVARQLARSINMQLYYDGRGRCVLRRRPGRVVWNFDAGDGGTVLTEPEVTYDLSNLQNTAWVRGRKAKGKPQVSATALPPRSHPLSPWTLGRNGNPRYLVLQEENDHIRTTAAAKQRAADLLETALIEGVEVSFDALPVPHLDPLDIVAVHTDTTILRFPLRQFSIPLVHSGVMSVGTNRRVTPDRRAIRPRPRRRGR